MTGTGLPASALVRALPAVEIADEAMLNSTAIGKEPGMRAEAADRMLAEMGLQYKDDKNGWRITDAGTAFGEIKPFHRNGHSGYQTLWKDSAVEVIRNHMEKSEKASQEDT